jgi:hypothetical protein
MEPVISWAIGIGSFIFALGMISAIGSRMQRSKQKSRPRKESEIVGVALTRKTSELSNCFEFSDCAWPLGT